MSGVASDRRWTTAALPTPAWAGVFHSNSWFQKPGREEEAALHQGG